MLALSLGPYINISNLLLHAIYLGKETICLVCDLACVECRIFLEVHQNHQLRVQPSAAPPLLALQWKTSSLFDPNGAQRQLHRIHSGRVSELLVEHREQSLSKDRCIKLRISLDSNPNR
jgi:hypothetical protein